MWQSVDALATGDHIHLDTLVENAPAPGSAAWLPLVLDLVTYLADLGARWVVTVPVGVVDAVPAVPPTAVKLFDIIDERELGETPAVYRIAAGGPNLRWAGEIHEWRQPLKPNVLEVLTLSRHAAEPNAAWDARIEFHVDPRPGPT
jgi:hypothetical protein